MTPEAAAARVRRLLRLVALLGAVLVAVLANAALDDDGSDAGPANPIRAAALRTEREPGGHAAFQIRYSVPGGPLVASTGTAAFDLRSGRVRGRIVAPAVTLTGTTTVRAYSDGRANFVSSPTYSRLLPSGFDWLRLEPWLGTDELFSLAGRWNPLDQLGLLGAAGEVEDLGEAEVLGVTTERFGGRVDLADYAAALAREGDTRASETFRALATQVPLSVRVEAWVDPAGRLRRLRTVTTLPRGRDADRGQDTDGETLTIDSRTDLVSFEEVAVPAPPAAADTLDATPFFRWHLGLLHGQSLPAPRPAGPPLSAAAFRRGVSATCTRGRRAGHRLGSRANAASAAIDRLEERLPPGPTRAERILDAYRAWSTVFLPPYLRLAKRSLDEVGRLAPPRNGRTDFESYLRILAEQIEELAAIQRASQLGEIPAARRISQEMKPLERRSRAIARELGLPRCISDDDHDSGEAEPSHAERPAFN